MLAHGRVSPFGHRGLNACVPLPRAYRSLPRPSSPLCAQASPTYVRSLDSALRGTNPSGTRSSKARAYRTSDASSRINSSQAALESCRSDYASLRFFVRMVTPSPLRNSACHPLPTFTSPSVVKQRPGSEKPGKPSPHGLGTLTGVDSEEPTPQSSENGWTRRTTYSENFQKPAQRPLLTRCSRKEVIQPQVPLRLPCYDFAPVTALAFGGLLLAVAAPTSGTHSFHGVTGGVYKARERIHRGMLIRDY